MKQQQGKQQGQQQGKQQGKRKGKQQGKRGSNVVKQLPVGHATVLCTQCCAAEHVLAWRALGAVPYRAYAVAQCRL